MSAKRTLTEIRPVAVLAGLILLLTSCSTERRLAHEYHTQKSKASIMLILPDMIYKAGFKVPDSINPDSLNENERKSVLLNYTDLIKNIDDTLFTEGYGSGMAYGLRQLGYKVYRDQNIHEFLENGNKQIILNLAQLELEEFYTPIRDESRFSDEDIYRHEFYITSVNINTWHEVTGLNHNDSVMQVLFKSHTASDHYDAGFRYFAISGEVKYLFTIDSLTVFDLYEAARNTGYLNAFNFHNYLLNEYISKNMPQGSIPYRKFEFDRISGKLRLSRSEGFIRLE